MGNLHLDRRAAALAERVADLPGEHLLTTEELAAWLAVHAVTVKRWRRDGEGPPTTWVGVGSVRYRKSDVLAWLQERAEAHRTAKAEG